MSTAPLYAIVQTTLDLPPVEKLARALTRVPGFVAADAPSLARDAFGILAHRLEAAHAGALQGALRAEGIETEFVPERELPPLPPGRAVRQIKPGPEALLIYDPLNRPFPIEWKYVLLVAAGEVRVQEFQQVRRMVRDPFAPMDRSGGGFGEASAGTRIETSTRERATEKPLLEIVLTGGVQRFLVEVAPPLFACLGERKRADTWENFTLLVRDLLEHAPQALPNRGAFCLRQEPPARFTYPSRNAFNEEIVWMLWRQRT